MLKSHRRVEMLSLSWQMGVAAAFLLIS